MDEKEREERLEEIFNTDFGREGEVPLELEGYQSSRIGIKFRPYEDQEAGDGRLIADYYGLSWRAALLELENYVDKRLLLRYEDIGVIWLDKDSGSVTDIEIYQDDLLNDVGEDDLINAVEQAGYQSTT